MKSNQRFIAGAACPNCKAIDVLLLNMQDQSISCVDCGFQQTESEREVEHAKQQQPQQQPVNKVMPKKVDISQIISITNIKK